jgi:hypothetical protein
MVGDEWNCLRVLPVVSVIGGGMIGDEWKWLRLMLVVCV